MKNILLVLFTILCVATGFSQTDYKLGPNSAEYDNIPRGTVTKYTWKSNIYTNTIRDYYIYVPAQYDASKSAALMIFQDGHAYVQADGDFRVPTVFDNLISQGKMPITIGLFINPGHDMNAAPVENPFRVSNRSIEYDDVSDTYARFLMEEMIPELKKQYNISDDAKMHAICGLSSGGICAFSAAWFHPEYFHKVLSQIGSFTDIRGGHNYPSMIRKNDKKDIKVFLQDGSNDLNNQFGNWWLANQQMASALKYKDYNYKFVSGTGEHNGKHGGAILPESLTWLWSDVIAKQVESGVYKLPEYTGDITLISGETPHFSNMKFKVVNIFNINEKISLQNVKQEQIFIIKEGKVEVSINNQTKTIGANSVVFLMPGDKGSIKSLSPDATYYTMVYTSKKPVNMERGKKEGGSFILDFNTIELKPHDKGGIRNYFHRATAMCEYYEMHVTNLNAGIKSHEPHTHFATEMVIMIDGETEMEIGNEIHQAKKGDVYFLPSNVPHAIKNIGNQQCMYFAFQWN